MLRRIRGKPMLIMLIGVGVLFGIIFIYKAFVAYMMHKYMAAGMPPATVSTTRVDYQMWQPTVQVAGSLRAVRGVDVTTEIEGLVRTIYFTPGSDVEKGELLVDLNADSDIAQLHSLQANADLADIVLKRDRAQFAIQAVSKAVVDSDEASLKSALAQVAEQSAIVDKKHIQAPFSGRLGVSQINPGQYLSPGDKIVTLQQLAPIYVDFYLPQQQMVQVALGQTVTLNLNTYSNRSFTGKITTINPQVDAETRNVEVEATLPNTKHELFPGMYANVTVNTGAPARYLTLPVSAISFNPYGDIVFIVKQQGKDEQGKPKLTATQSFVTLGPTRGNQVAILSGLKPGDTVVTSGLLKLKNGSEVVINNTVVPSDQANPHVVNE